MSVSNDHRTIRAFSGRRVERACRVVVETMEPRTLLSASVQLNPLGSYATNTFDEGGAEIIAYDPGSRRMFSVNGAANAIDILSVSSTGSLTKVGAIDVTEHGGGAQSVAVNDGVLAVAIQNENKVRRGNVSFFNAATARFINSVKVGALPDMLTFTPDGRNVLVANEGEPDDSYKHDPEGSISIIPVWKGIGNIDSDDVLTAKFAPFNGQKKQLLAQGVRIYGPGATVAQDLEPEYVAVSKDSKTAWVTLQENNAIAKIDVRTAKVTKIIPLGFKDYGRPNALTKHTFDSLPVLGTTAAGESINLGGFSGLFYEGVNPQNGNLVFVTHPDRGPNPEPRDVDGDGVNERPFALPNFQPEIVRFELNKTTGKLTILDRIKLKRADGTPLTGMPNLAGPNGLAYSDEEPVDLFGNPIPLDPFGGDLEGIIRTPDGHYWLSDEYRPAIYHFAPDGSLIERFVPNGTNAGGVFTGTEAFPAVYAQRRANRGFEAIAYQNGKIYAFIQSPIDNPDVANDANSRASVYTRILEFDPVTKTTTGQYLYKLEGGLSDKIGDAVSIGDGRFLVVERDDAVGAAALKKVFTIDISKATNLNTIDETALPKTIERMTADELKAAGITTVSKRVRVDLIAAGYDTYDKVEGLALIDENTIAVINDNDFNMSGQFDPATGRLVPDPTPTEPTLGVISLRGNKLDPSDRDRAINIRNAPVLGMYQPDAIAAVEFNGRTYLLTANEGDARAWGGFNEEARVADLTLDPTAFPNAAELKKPENLGRLRVTNALGDTDGDGDFDKLYAFGGRSFSVWTEDGELVWDSGDDFEQITADLLPGFFNASSTNNTFDDRSDDKGPEPEGLTIGEIDGELYAFIGLERIGGVMIYNVSNPTAPKFVSYSNNRNFSGSPSAGTAGDLGPEGLLFLRREESPTGDDLLGIANEISGTVTLFDVQTTAG